ncbi:MAG: hypothetical protein AUJ47_08135 [Candidatus Marinimicrobia bacterium CG1_02_48_14]|nr:MAG: hypothetical protein AUJ47_08135 [Candidatus Marinimicrobia bacterium CG1_02_48_14]
MVDALNVVLGDRAYRDVIREGSEFAWVEAEFLVSSDQIKRNLQDWDGPLTGLITLTREIRSQGASKVWINGVPATVQQLKTVGDVLVDLHGQHEHQFLLNEDHHIDFLDAFAETEAEQEVVRTTFKNLQMLENRLRTIEMDQTQFREKFQLFQFQLKEIDEVEPVTDELENLDQERRVLENAQRLNELASEINELTPTITGRVGKILQFLAELGEFDKEADGYLPEIEAASVSLNAVAEWAEIFQQKTQADPERLELIHQRITRLRHLCQKYNRSLAEVLSYREELKLWLRQASETQPDKDGLRRQIVDARVAFSKSAEKLSQKRTLAAQELSRQIIEKLQRLGIPHAQFDVRVTQDEQADGAVEIHHKQFVGDHSGMDRVAFWMQTNPGESMRPLVRVASGGEISRVMLAIKASLSGRDRIGTVIFDEIDSGISGKIARIVGHELANLSRFHQILCITHLPQIASLANQHYRVEKVLQTNGRAVTRVTHLEGDLRVEEIAGLLGTGAKTAASFANARELLAGNA